MNSEPTRAEGFQFVERLVAEWDSGVSRFDGPGETLLGCFESGKLIAVGGVHCDPFAGRPEIGRVRHVYVRPLFRKRGVGVALVAALIEAGRQHYQCLRLRPYNPAAARIYERLGFQPVSAERATHILHILNK